MCVRAAYKCVNKYRTMKELLVKRSKLTSTFSFRSNACGLLTFLTISAEFPAEFNVRGLEKITYSPLE